MDYTFYSVEKNPPIAWIYLNRPEKKNAMPPAAWKETIPIFNDLDKDDDIRTVIIAAKGDAFSTGLDLITAMPEMPELLDKEQKGGIKWRLLTKITEMQAGISRIENSKKPVIAAVHGYCLGLGLDLICACDIRICAKDAIFSLKEASLGFVADMGVLQRLPLIVGQGFARELAYTAKNFNPQRAMDMGLINAIYEDRDSLLKAAEAMASEISSNSPLAVQASKEVLNFSIRSGVEEGLRYVASVSANIIPSNDLFEAVTAFTQKRKPEFTGK